MKGCVAALPPELYVYTTKVVEDDTYVEMKKAVPALDDDGVAITT